jgi:acyl-CoA thioesterase FadM
VFHRLHRGRDEVTIATGEQMHLHVDTGTAKASIMDAKVHAKLEAIRSAQAGLDRPREAGRSIGRP